MPFIRIDAVEGRSAEQIQTLLDASHRAILKAFHVPESDRYQVYTEHKRSQLVIGDTGLNIPRTYDAVIFTVFSKARQTEMKVALYAALAEELAISCSMSPQDIVVAVIENSPVDWSFGNGEAQFLTGKLT